MKKIIYIAGLPHSGSTLLTVLLGAHPSMFGVGEIQKIIDPNTRDSAYKKFQRAKCTCGKNTRDCVYWCKLLQHVQAGYGYGDCYEQLISAACNSRGKDTIIVDSTKTCAALKQLVDEIRQGAVEGVRVEDILVLHVVKDVRSYLASSRRRYGVSSWNIPRLVWYSRQWVNNNIAIQEFIKANKLHSHIVSYERLCFLPENELALICDKAGVNYSDQMLTMDASQSCIGLGNTMRVDPEKSSRIVYDDRWFYDFGINFTYMISPNCSKFNRKIRGF